MRKKIYDIIEVNDDGGVFSRIYDYFMLFAIVASIFPLCFKQSNHIFVLIDKITVIAFMADYVLRWSTADFKLKKGRINSFIIYPFTPFAIIDLLSILPSLTTLNAGFKLFRIARMYKALKVLRILRYSKSFRIILNVIKKEQESLFAVCYLALGYIFLSALIMFSVEPSSFDTFFDAIYWSVVTLTTVGYGDIYPVSDLGRVFSMISSFIGIAIVALPTGIITAGCMNELHNNNNDKEK